MGKKPINSYLKSYLLGIFPYMVFGRIREFGL